MYFLNIYLFIMTIYHKYLILDFLGLGSPTSVLIYLCDIINFLINNVT